MPLKKMLESKVRSSWAEDTLAIQWINTNVIFFSLDPLQLDVKQSWYIFCWGGEVKNTNSEYSQYFWRHLIEAWKSFTRLVNKYS